MWRPDSHGTFSLLLHKSVERFQKVACYREDFEMEIGLVNLPELLLDRREGNWGQKTRAECVCEGVSLPEQAGLLLMVAFSVPAQAFGVYNFGI